MIKSQNSFTGSRYALLSIFFCACLSGCAPILTRPVDSSSSLIIGRVVINNKAQFSHLNIVPIGTIEQFIDVEVESLDGKQLLKATTGEQGYFFIPNMPPGTYRIQRVIIERELRDRGKETVTQPMQSPPFTPLPRKVGYVGTYLIDISERNLAKVNIQTEGESIKDFLLQKYGTSLWATREFVTLVPKQSPRLPLVQEKKPQKSKSSLVHPAGSVIDKPEWKTGYTWRYTWKGPKGKGTFTREVIREDTFNGSPAYAVKVGKAEEFVTRDGLGLLGRTLAGKVITQRTAPRQILSWPLTIGKEWRNTYTLENLEEKSSSNLDYRLIVSKIERVRVFAGAFEAYKIDCYDFSSGALLSEYWYSPQVKWFIRVRIYFKGGIREEELLSFIVDR